MRKIFILFSFVVSHYSFCTTVEQEIAEQIQEHAQNILAEKPKTPLFVAIGTVFPQYKSTLASQVAGRVEEVLVNIGDRVKKDDPLVMLETLFFEIDLRQKEAALVGAKVELEDAGLNLNRMKKLWEKPEGEAPSVPQKRFDDAKTKYDQALVQVKLHNENAKRAKAHLEEALIKAPFDGIITKRFVDPGECITSAPISKMLEIQSLEKLFVEFSCPQADLRLLSLGCPIIIVDEAERYFGTIDLMYPDIDENTHSGKCRAYIVNNDLKLRPGTLVKVEVFAK